MHEHAPLTHAHKLALTVANCAHKDQMLAEERFNHHALKWNIFLHKPIKHAYSHSIVQIPSLANYATKLSKSSF